MMRLLTVIPELQPFLERLRPRFTRRQFRHLARYVIGLVAARRKTIRSIARSTAERFDQSSLNRFMNSGAWETETLSAACKTMAIDDHKDCPGGEILLIIDDTLLEKTGETMESVGYQYSVKDGESILSHDLVSCVMVCSCGQVVPVDLRHYVKAKVCKQEGREFKTRVELAREMVESFALPPGSAAAKKRVVVLFDSWYLCKEIVDAVKRRGWHFVSESKSNRRIRMADGAIVNSSDVNLDDDAETMPFRGRTYLHRELDVYMPSLGMNGDVRLMVERETDGKDENHYVVTDMRVGISAEELLSLLKARHLTEEFYRDAKQNLGLESYMVRGHEATNRHWWTIFLAYMSLNHLRRTISDLEEMTVGQLCEWVEERCEQIKWNGPIPLSLPVT